MTHEIKVINGEIELTYGRYGFHYDSAEDMASNMMSADVERLLDVCDGDFTKLSDKTAKALAIKSRQMIKARTERNKQQAKEAKELREARHKLIMEEIEAAVSDLQFFTPTLIQEMIIRNGGIPHTRQMYTAHLRKACREGKAQRIVKKPEEHPVVYVTGKIGSQKTRKIVEYKFD